MTKRLLRVLSGERCERPPFWLMRQAGRYLPEYRKLRGEAGSFLDLCYTPDLAAEVTLQPVRRFSLDAAILFSDILVVPQGLGQAVDFVEARGPVLEPICNSADLARLDGTDITARLSPVYRAVERVVQDLPENVALIGFAGAPWTVATYMVEGGITREFGVVKSWAFEEAESFQRLIDLLVDATAAHLIAQIAAGAEIVQIFESWAGVLPARAFERWCTAPVAAVTRKVKARYPSVPVIAFPRGAGILYEDYAAATGIDALGLDSTVPTKWAARHLQTKVPVQGNLDPRLLVIGGKAMEAAVADILEDLAGGPFVFNLGHGVFPETPPGHVEALARLLLDGRT
ncbi:MAG: uroporphyrinogen decarboxylase [Alphaproteobacteria bacterium]|nr:uroporphyrinogen decarboxylase [Alphaproteobacteria bacterium]